MKPKICADPNCGHEKKMHAYEKEECYDTIFMSRCPCKKFKEKKDE